MQFGAGEFDDPHFFEKSHKAKIVSQEEKRAHYGLPQWGVREWKGNLYPKDLRPEDFLKAYASLFSCVEVSSTFYAPVQTETLQGWKAQVAPGFKFLPKWPKRMTHDLQLRVAAKELHSFVEGMQTLGENLGTTILQLPPSFSREFRRELFLFLEQLPKDFPVALELRHSSWFETHPQTGQNEVLPRLYDYLARREVGLVLSDTPQRRELFHLCSPGRAFVVRYLSDENPQMDVKRLSWWQEKLEEFREKTCCYFVLHQPDNASTPRLMNLLDSGFEDKRKKALGETQQLDLLS